MRNGLYTGFVDGEIGWTLIYDQDVDQRGDSELTHLGSFSDTVAVAAYSFVSFYVYNPEKLTYQYIDTYREGAVVVEEESLEVYAGVALAYGKWTGGCGGPQPDGKCLFAPRAFSGAIEYSLSLSSGGAVTNDGGKTDDTTSTSTTTCECLVNLGLMFILPLVSHDTRRINLSNSSDRRTAARRAHIRNSKPKERTQNRQRPNVRNPGQEGPGRHGPGHHRALERQRGNCDLHTRWEL